MATLGGKTMLRFSGLFVLLLFSMLLSVSARNRRYTAPSITRLTDMFAPVSVEKAFNKVFGASNIQFTGNGSSAYISLNKTSGSGLTSLNKYYYGFFSAAMKLPAGLSPGVVVAFYMSNAETFPHNHDEIDIELLGHDKRNDWVLQTNIYANGSVKTGREEKFYLWFDPTQQHHYYSLIWNRHHIVFLVDNIPVREFPNTGAFSATYPSKPMSLYATIWDGSEWATHGGKYPVNYSYAPFVASITDMEVDGCVPGPKQQLPLCAKKSPSSSDPIEGQGFAALSNQQRSAMNWARSKLMFYSYCKDTSRYKPLPPECR